MTIIIATLCIFVISALISLYAFLIMPRVNDGADTELISCDFAKNGLWDKNIPEASMAAFYLAIERGYGIALSVRLSADKKVMVFEDDKLLRMCGVKKQFKCMPSRELKKLSLLGTNQKIPYLSQVLRLCDGRVPLLIEIKCEQFDTGLCRRVANILDNYGGAFAIHSLDPRVLGWFKDFRPSFARGQIITKATAKSYAENPFKRFMMSNMMMNFISRPDFIVVDAKHVKKIPFKICNKIFKTKCFVTPIRSKAAYRFCRKRAFHTIFEKIRP